MCTSYLLIFNPSLIFNGGSNLGEMFELEKKRHPLFNISAKSSPFGFSFFCIMMNCSCFFFTKQNCIMITIQHTLQYIQPTKPTFWHPGRLKQLHTGIHMFASWHPPFWLKDILSFPQYYWVNILDFLMRIPPNQVQRYSSSSSSQRRLEMGIGSMASNVQVW